jgi:hypothetical protein
MIPRPIRLLGREAGEQTLGSGQRVDARLRLGMWHPPDLDFGEQMWLIRPLVLVSDDAPVASRRLLLLS